MFGIGPIEVCFVLFPLIILSLAGSAVMLMGAWRMRHLESYPLCLAAAVIAVIPLHAGFFVGLPFGIWALTLLSNPEVKAAFRENAARQRGK